MSLQAENNRRSRGKYDATKAEYHTYPKDDVSRFEPGASIGGPVMHDRMWYFGAYQPVRQTTERHIDAASTGIATATPSNTTQKVEVQYLKTNATNQFGNKLRTRVAFNNSWSKTDGQLATLNGGATHFDYSKGTSSELPVSGR